MSISASTTLRKLLAFFSITAVRLVKVRLQRGRSRNCRDGAQKGFSLTLLEHDIADPVRMTCKVCPFGSISLRGGGVTTGVSTGSLLASKVEGLIPVFYFSSTPSSGRMLHRQLLLHQHSADDAMIQWNCVYSS